MPTHPTTSLPLLLPLLLLTTPTLASPQPQEPSTITAPTTTITALTETQTTYIAAASATTPASPQYTSPLTLRTSILNSTNLYRYQHNASYIPWNNSLASYAEDYAAKCIWAHSYGPQGYGENLARGYEDVTGAVDAWGDERGLYDFGGGSGGGDVTGFTEETGHFTQLVWKETQSVGCGVFACNGQNDVGGYMLVCEYWPPGNIQGVNSKDKNVYFEENVQRQVREGDGGFDTFSATVGATGVTGTATAGAVPSSSSSESGAGRIRGVGVGWRQCGLGILVAVLACV